MGSSQARFSRLDAVRRRRISSLNHGREDCKRRLSDRSPGCEHAEPAAGLSAVSHIAPYPRQEGRASLFMVKLKLDITTVLAKEPEMEKVLKTHIDPITTRLAALFEKIWPLIRPAASTRLAWLVAAAGVALLVQPFWEPILVAAAARYLAVEVDDLPGPGWGLALIVIALVYHYLMVRGQSLDQRLSRDRVRDHDKSIVERLEKDYPLKDLEILADSVGTDHSYFLDQNNLGKLTRALRDPVNRFLDKSLAASAEQLADVSSKLSIFLQQHFFVFGKWERMRLALYPDLNEDRAERGRPTAEDRALYHQRARELHALLDEVDAAREDFVVKSHHRLA